MLIALWILNILLALVFLAAGGAKVARPRTELQDRMEWVENFSDSSVKAIGVVEILGALGLILPLATGIAPILTPIAALGLALTMLLASVLHLRRKESPALPLILMVLAIVSAVLGFLLLS